MIGPIPPSFGNLTQLNVLCLADNQLTGPILPSIGNLIQLNELSLAENQLTGPIPSSIGNLIRLNNLYLQFNQLTGSIPSLIGNLIQLTHLDIGKNKLTGLIPSSIGNLIQLNDLYLGHNQLTGPIPSSIWNLTHLSNLDLFGLDIFVDFVQVCKLKGLILLALSGNQVSIEEHWSNATLPRYSFLELSSCNLTKFPDFLRSQDQLEYLDLSRNNIHGKVKEWMWKISKESLRIINFSNNFLKGFSQNSILIPWIDLQILDLSF